MDDNEKQKDEKVRLTGLWKNTSAGGKAYYSGTLGAARILGFPNYEKRGDKSPDLVLYLVPRKPKEESNFADGQSDSRPEFGSQNIAGSQGNSQSSGIPDDVPF